MIPTRQLSLEDLPRDHLLRKLQADHRAILRHLDALEALVGAERLVDALTERERLSRIQALGKLLLGAERHDRLEEHVLYPALRQRGIQSPLTAIEFERAEARALARAVTDHATRMLHGDRSGRPGMRRDALSLVGLLRDHIWKKENVLYPCALRVIEEDAWPGLLRQGNALERETQVQPA